jgi:hypothetical protein
MVKVRDQTTSTRFFACGSGSGICLGWETDFWSSSSTLGLEEDTFDSIALGVELKTKEGGGTE